MLNEARHYFLASVKSVDGSNLIFTHEAAIAFNIGTVDASEFTLNFSGNDRLLFEVFKSVPMIHATLVSCLRTGVSLLMLYRGQRDTLLLLRYEI